MDEIVMIRSDFVDNIIEAIPEGFPNRTSYVGFFLRMASECYDRGGTLTLPGKEAPEKEIAELLGMDVTSAKSALDVLTRDTRYRKGKILHLLKSNPLIVELYRQKRLSAVCWMDPKSKRRAV